MLDWRIMPQQRGKKYSQPATRNTTAMLEKIVLVIKMKTLPYGITDIHVQHGYNRNILINWICNYLFNTVLYYPSELLSN